MFQPEGDTTLSGDVVGPSQMQKYGRTRARNNRIVVVAEHNHEIVDMVIAPEIFRAAAVRHLNGSVILAI